LFQPYKEMKDGASSWVCPDKPRREKYDGAKLNVFTKIAAVWMFMLGFAAMQKASKAGSLRIGQMRALVLSVALGMLSLRTMGQILDSGSFRKD